jgi:hypothetical protein
VKQAAYDREDESPGLGIAALVLGLLGLVMSPLLIGGLFGLIALIIGITHLRSRPRRRGLTYWGMGLGLLGVGGYGVAAARLGETCRRS